MYDAELHHQWELEQQERDMEEQENYEAEKNRILGLMFAQLDCIQAYENNKLMREISIQNLNVLRQQYKQLQDQFWGQK